MHSCGALFRTRMKKWNVLVPLNTRNMYSSRSTNRLMRWSRTFKISGGFAALLGGGVLISKIPDEILLDSEEKVQNQMPVDYAPDALESYWSSRPLAVTARVLDIAGKMGPFIFQTLYEYQIRGLIQHDEALQAENGARLRTILTELGPCFIKLGQVSLFEAHESHFV
jgi:hypothetical protein